MILLYRYIFFQFLRNIFMLMAGFIAIYLLIDFFEKIDNFLEKGKSMALVFHFFLLNIPFIVEQMGPVCILLAGVVTLGILNHSNELIALKAGGIPLKKITYPILGGGLLFTLLFLAMSQFVLPKTVAETNRIWHKEVKGRIPLGIYRSGRYYYRGQEGFYSFARPSPSSDNFLFFSYTSWDEEYQLTTNIAAREARWADGTWTLHKGQIQQARGKSDFSTELFTSREFGFAERPENFFVPEYQSLELSLLDLYKETRHQNSPDETNMAWANFYGRISYTLLGLPLLFLGLPLLLIVYRKWGKDLSLAVPVSCGMAFACWGIWGTLQSLAKASYLSPMIAALSVHLLMMLLGFSLLVREEG
ncbi:LptF/LptG family permease [Desulfogranum mediterraneum]|uniref:LptF/LptG family permease n=1 Tax=Desulfogranum mediterraneum TaxID=160661 RepID=UPI000416405F|nr:LptF/LptG family permease [Desulfogranum mediterraneum]